MAKNPKPYWSYSTILWKLIEATPKSDHWLIRIKNCSNFPAALTIVGLEWSELKGDPLKGELIAISDGFAQPSEDLLFRFSLTRNGKTVLSSNHLIINYLHWGGRGRDFDSASTKIELPSLEAF